MPHHLVAAFRATLEEVLEADVLIHVVDSSHPDREVQMEAVEEVLEELGAANKPIVTVFNKSDLMTDPYQLREWVARTPDSCYISALTKDGLSHLLTTIESTVERLLAPIRVRIPFAESHLLAQCHESGKVSSVDYENDATIIEGRFARELANRLRPYQV